MATPNWSNRTIFTGDNLYVMRGMNSESVDLIYADPPFNSNRTYSAPVGSKAAGASFKDTWTLSDLDEAWHNQILETNEPLYRVIDASRHSHSNGMMSYLCMMAVRLLEMRRLLKPTGSIYIHCDPYASHYLKQVMDVIFGPDNFRNEIIWHYGQRTAILTKHFSKKHDVILFYAKLRDAKVNRISQPWDRAEFLAHRHDVKVDEQGREFIWTDGGQSGKRYKRWVDDVLDAGKPFDDVWDIALLNSSAKERVGYPTQKPLALLERIIKASSNEGDMVLDPFAGCATTCVAAATLERQWVGIDLSEKAAELVNMRLQDTLGSLYHHAFVTAREDIPQRKDLADIKPFITQKQWLYGAQDGYCKGCRSHFPVQNFTIDHIIPRSKGGTDHVENLQLLCGHCNSLKGDRPMEYLLARLAAANGYAQRYA